MKAKEYLYNHPIYKKRKRTTANLDDKELVKIMQDFAKQYTINVLKYLYQGSTVAANEAYEMYLDNHKHKQDGS